MIRAGSKAFSKLVDKLAFGQASSVDVSHLVEIRPLRRHEVELVASELNPARNAATHRARLNLQDDGALIYLIAWIEHTPVGHGMLLWNGPTGSPKQHIDQLCPYVEDLWVRNDLRSRGIGARILAEMAMLAIAHGYRAVSLSVGVDNRRAIDLYRRMGFTPTRTPTFTLSGMVTAADGETHFWSERCQYMLKWLDYRQDRSTEIA